MVRAKEFWEESLIPSSILVTQNCLSGYCTTWWSEDCLIKKNVQPHRSRLSLTVQKLERKKESVKKAVKILIKCCKWMQMARFRFSIPSMWLGFHRFSGHVSMYLTQWFELPLVFNFCWASWGVVRISLRQLTFRASSRGRGTKLRFFGSYPLVVCIAWYQDIPRHCWLDVLYGDSQTPGFGP